MGFIHISAGGAILLYIGEGGKLRLARWGREVDLYFKQFGQDEIKGAILVHRTWNDTIMALKAAHMMQEELTCERLVRLARTGMRKTVL